MIQFVQSSSFTVSAYGSSHWFPVLSWNPGICRKWQESIGRQHECSKSCFVFRKPIDDHWLKFVEYAAVVGMQCNVSCRAWNYLEAIIEDGDGAVRAKRWKSAWFVHKAHCASNPKKARYWRRMKIVSRAYRCSAMYRYHIAMIRLELPGQKLWSSPNLPNTAHSLRFQKKAVFSSVSQSLVRWYWSLPNLCTFRTNSAMLAF